MNSGAIDVGFDVHFDVSDVVFDGDSVRLRSRR